MDLKTLTSGRDTILKDMAGALKAHAVDTALVERPPRSNRHGLMHSRPESMCWSRRSVIRRRGWMPPSPT